MPTPKALEWMGPETMGPVSFPTLMNRQFCVRDCAILKHWVPSQLHRGGGLPLGYVEPSHGSPPHQSLAEQWLAESSNTPRAGAFLFLLEMGTRGRWLLCGATPELWEKRGILETVC